MESVMTIAELHQTRNLLCDVTGDDVVALRAEHGVGLVSILLQTTANGTFGADDHLRANALVVEAERRLALEPDGSAARALDDVRAVLAALPGARTGAGLALFEHDAGVLVRRVPITLDD